MDIQAVLKILKKYMETHRVEMGILAMGVFGSVARNEAGQDSDVDVVVSLSTPNLFTLSRIRQDLEEELHHHVDLVSYRDRMNPFLKERIEQDACYV
ncbi:MAG: nucleotidyltransferase [Lentisphaerae bacterium]|jgi:predicted nucleotidyltransferase|nr:nucleotidyltransferase [Lentisphaerota bacterium]